VAAGLEIADVRHGHRVEADAALGIGSELDYPIRVFVGQRAEQHLIYDGEHGGVDTDAESQSEDCGQSESGGFDELAQRVFYVVPEHSLFDRLFWIGNTVTQGSVFLP